MADENTPLPDDDTKPDGDMEKLFAEVEQWLAQDLEQRRVRQESHEAVQLSLLAPLDGCDMAMVRDYLLKLAAIEAVLSRIKEMQAMLYKDLTVQGLPAKTIRNGLKAARARRKATDGSQEMFDRCVALALSLMKEYEPVD